MLLGNKSLSANFRGALYDDMDLTMNKLVEPRVHRDHLSATRNKWAVTKKALGFGLVGIINTVVDLCAFWIAFVAIGLPLIEANVLAWLVAVSGSFFMHTFITFATETGRKPNLGTYTRFVASGIVGLVANTATLVLAALFVPIPVAKLMAIIVGFSVNFSLSYFMVFRPRPPP